MGRSPRKLNFLIEQSVCRDLERFIPTGKRSKFVNEVLRKELELIRRRKALQELLASPPLGKKFPNRKIVEGLAKDRRAH